VKSVSAYQGWGPPVDGLDALYFWIFADDHDPEGPLALHGCHLDQDHALALLPGSNSSSGSLSDSEVRAACKALGWRCVCIFRVANEYEDDASLRDDTPITARIRFHREVQP
jgi:hypothetical protein